NLLADLETQLGATLLDCTVMRIRGFFQVNYSAAPVAGTSALTMAIREDDRALVSLPAAQLLAQRGPGSSDRYGNWMHRQYWHDTQLTYLHPLPERTPDFDVRARRKLDEQQSALVMYTENHVGSANTLNYTWAIDILLAMP
ncbi:hypothetical protein, partial [Campylobacter coli]